MTPRIKSYLQQITLPQDESHKGQNGRLLIIGGSELFHAASKWSLDIASKFVDMVFYSSVPSNNELVKEAKGEFWNGIVVPREQLESYLDEADCILIGPGMTRVEPAQRADWTMPLTTTEWEHDTQRVVNFLLSNYGFKKWVIDAGALQMMDPHLLTESCIITPHHRELEMVLSKMDLPQLQQTGATIVVKGVVDQVMTAGETIEVAGGNPGMTKGGTGDVLAGLIAALYCTHDKETAAVVGSYINKAAGDALAQQVGPFFNASDLVHHIPQTLWTTISKL
jgi:hydroxyethylthiazole kinase-like uncharacterized protein yjeF